MSHIIYLGSISIRAESAHSSPRGSPASQPGQSLECLAGKRTRTRFPGEGVPVARDPLVCVLESHGHTGPESHCTHCIHTSPRENGAHLWVGD